MLSLMKVFGSVAIGVCALGLLITSVSAQQTHVVQAIEVTVAEHVPVIRQPGFTAGTPPTGTTSVPIPNMHLPIIFESYAPLGTATLPPGTVVQPPLWRYFPLFEVQ